MTQIKGVPTRAVDDSIRQLKHHVRDGAAEDGNARYFTQDELKSVLTRAWFFELPSHTQTEDEALTDLMGGASSADVEDMVRKLTAAGAELTAADRNSDGMIDDAEVSGVSTTAQKVHAFAGSALKPFDLDAELRIGTARGTVSLTRSEVEGLFASIDEAQAAVSSGSAPSLPASAYPKTDPATGEIRNASGQKLTPLLSSMGTVVYFNRATHAAEVWESRPGGPKGFGPIPLSAGAVLPRDGMTAEESAILAVSMMNRGALG
jgi:hypothetical protein